jgi:hypothetical protein
MRTRSSAERFGGVVAACVALAALALVAGTRPTPYDNFVLLADAFLHGRVWIDWPGAYIDALRYGDRYYIIEAPLPAVLLVPFVRAFGTGVNQTILAEVLGAVATFAGWEIAATLGVPLRTRILLCGFLLLGTDLFWCAMLGDVWFIAHVASVAFTLLALLELLRGRRGWLVALFAACAVESRFALALALPVYGAMLAFGSGSAADRGRRVAAFALVLLPFAAAWVWYNELRWGLPYDVGYTDWYHQDSAGMPTGSPFAIRYLSYQLQSFFVQYPDRIPSFPYLVPSISGVALTWTSPALVLAFFARRPLGLVLPLWLLTLLTAAPNFIYYVNGYAQFGMRHALDFEPFLFVLMALALRGGATAVATALLLYSMLAGSWGVWFWKVYVRH